MGADLVGRQDELGRLTGGLTAALEGRGSVWLVTGEAGIGKTTLVDAVTAYASRAQARCVWGRCWEGGGAPSYWPWIQVLRSALDEAPDIAAAASAGPRAPLLAGLVPEHVAGEEAPRYEPQQETFRLFDAVTEVLRQVSKQRPLVILLEDLHVADVASVSLLDFIARQIDQCPILIVATYREQDAARGPVGAPLAKVALRANRLSLERLKQDDVAAMLPGRPSSIVKRAFEVSEGNPLFVVELSRVLGLSGDEARLPISEGIRAVIREHLTTVSPETQQCLQEASVLGRDVSTDAVARLGPRQPDAVERHLIAAVQAGLMIQSGLSSFRFSHFLIREVLHADLPSTRRAELHRAAADHLAVQTPPPWAELLMHYRSSGPTAQSLAHRAAREAGDQAMAQLAVEDAVAYYDQALKLMPAGDAERDVDRHALLLLMAKGQLIIGEIEAGKNACVEASEIARRLGRPDLFARAALELGGIFIIGNVDATMIDLLEASLSLLDDGPSALRAQVMARLAAARQPAPDLAEPVAMAKEAIDMARCLNDPDVLLATLRAGLSAMMDIAAPSERRPLNEEHVALATELDQRVEMLRGHQRLAIDTLELADVAAFRASARTADMIAEGLDHPFYQWRPGLLLAAEAAASGRFDEAHAHGRRAKHLAERSNEPMAELSLAMHEVGDALAQEDDDRIRAGLTAVTALFCDVQLDSAFGNLIVVGALARMEDADDPRGLVVERDLQVALQFQDIGSLTMVAEAAWLHGDRTLASRIAPAVKAAPQVLASWGLIGLTCGGPVDRARGMVAAALGDAGAAEAAFREALTVVEREGLEPMRARLLYDLFRLTGRPKFATEALRTATYLCMPGLIARVEARQARPVQRSESTVPRLSMRLEAGVWIVESGQRRFHVRRTKGADMLATLLQHPGREHHVLDLVSGGRGTAGDAGTSGPALDDDARAKYRSRLEELESSLAEAEEWADTGRVERLKAERDAIATELARAYGLGGRARTGGSASERARVNVQRRLKDAIRRIADHDPELGKWLERSVITGTYCRFDPP